jgi:hypothetical protein
MTMRAPSPAAAASEQLAGGHSRTSLAPPSASREAELRCLQRVTSTIEAGRASVLIPGTTDPHREDVAVGDIDGRVYHRAMTGRDIRIPGRPGRADGDDADAADAGWYRKGLRRAGVWEHTRMDASGVDALRGRDRGAGRGADDDHRGDHKPQS